MDDAVNDTRKSELTPYFAVSLLKLSLMSLCTFGVYQLWWFYKNWCRIKHREQSNISPAWRAVFAAIWVYPCFSRIRASAKSSNLPVTLPAGPLALIWFVTLNLDNFHETLWPLALLSFVWLLPAQIVANRINSAIVPDHDPNGHFSGWNISALALGGGFVVLGLIGVAMKS